MNSDNILIRMVVNGLAGAVIGGLLLGLVGALFAGGNGFLNGAILGGVFGLVAGFATPNTRLSAIHWFTRGLSRHADQREEDKYER